MACDTCLRTYLLLHFWSEENLEAVSEGEVKLKESHCDYLQCHDKTFNNSKVRVTEKR